MCCSAAPLGGCPYHPSHTLSSHSQEVPLLKSVLLFVSLLFSLKFTNMVVPVIDVSGLHGDEREKIKTEIAKACLNAGFFQIVNHRIPESLMERVKNVVTENYKLEREKVFKESVPVQVLNTVIQKEKECENGEPKKTDDLDWEDVYALQYDDEEYVWPNQPTNFKETLVEFGAEVKKQAEELLEVLSEILGLEKGYLKKVLAGGEGAENKAYFGTKVSHYPPCPRPDLIWGLRAHTDAGGLILLFQDDEVAGLQAKRHDNDEWVDVQPLHNSIIIDCGDQLEAISNGLFKSAWHRIHATQDGNRMSVASYYNPSLDSLIEPAILPVTSASPLESGDNHKENGGVNGTHDNAKKEYPKFRFGDYMNVYAKQKYLPKEPRFQAASLDTPAATIP